jgi:hypothetical protein
MSFVGHWQYDKLVQDAQCVLRRPMGSLGTGVADHAC